MINAVVDLSHHNGTVDLVRAKNAGILGIICKATQGLTFKDPEYSVYKKQAKDAGLMFGAYHFGVASDGSAQADYFLNTVQPDAQTLLILDFEENPTGSTMTLDETHDFVTHIQARTGRWPGLYGGSLLRRTIGLARDPLLSQCWLWVPQYAPQPIWSRGTWPYWTMWQYTDGAAGNEPHTVDGIGRCDRNIFNGDETGLRALWGSP